MSGSGTGSGFGSGGGAGSVDCSSLAFETHISSPNPTMVVALRVGDILEVGIKNLNGINVVSLLKDGSAVGGLVDFSDRISDCIDAGFDYIATVRSINGGAIKVFVQSV